MEQTSEEIKKQEKKNSDEGFWSKVKKYAVNLGVKPLYMVLLFYYSIQKASFLDKVIIIGSLGYLISPLDIIPDTIPIIGFVDDVAVLMFAHSRVKNNIDDEVRQKSKDKLSFLLGDYDESIIKDL